jgi:NhaP-type Na+/H+ or K+/H+ antiporter
MLLYMRELVRGLNRYFVKFILRQYLVSVLVYVLILGTVGIDGVVRDDVNAAFGPEFLFRRILDVIVFGNSSSIVRKRRQST